MATRNPLTIPERDRVSCVQCGQTIDARAIGNAQAVTGYAVNRAQGGANTIALMERVPSWLCRFCLADRKHGRSWEQPALFEL